MALIVLGINHETAPTALREKVALSAGDVEHACHMLVEGNACITEAAVLSTCNRTEVYAVAHTLPLGKEALLSFLVAYGNLDEAHTASFERCAYFHHGRQCAHHLFRVASSLDSLVLGEAQILGQVRDALAHAEAAGTAGRTLSHLFRQALEAGKRVRTETTIGQQAVSVSTVAARAALQMFPKPDDRRILIVGAGQTAELAAGYLAEQGVARMSVANRTLENARQLAQRFGGSAFPLDQLEEAIAESTIVISSTGASEYVIDEPLVRRARARAAALREREDASEPEAGEARLSAACASAEATPLLIIDIALPRDVDPRCAEIPGVTCMSLDDLGSLISQNKRARQHAATQAERIADEETNRFLIWMQEQTLTPTIKEIYGKADGICQREVDHAMRELAKAQDAPVSPEQHAVLEALARAVSKKILHGPVTRMRKQAANPEAYLYTEAARFLFGLDSNPHGLPCANNPAKCHIDTHGSCRFAEVGTCPFGRKAPRS